MCYNSWYDVILLIFIGFIDFNTFHCGRRSSINKNKKLFEQDLHIYNITSNKQSKTDNALT